MRRREFIILISGATVGRPFAVHAQQARRPRRVGIVMPYAKGDSEIGSQVQALRQELARLGWTNDGNIQFDERWTTDNMDLVRANAASLLASNPDVVVAIGGRVISVLLQISHSIPIVIPGASDPIGVGWATSLARPGGNLTGFTSLELSVLAKSLEMLKQIAPTIVQVALIYNPDNPNTAFYKRTFKGAAASLAVEPTAVPVHEFADIDRAITSLADRQNVGVLFPPDISITALRNEVVALVERRHIPAIYSDAIFVKVGGLMSYGIDRTDLFRRAAGYVDRILRGEKAADLPFQQPTKYQLVLNLKTAKALGLNLPATLLAQADEVIE